MKLPPLLIGLLLLTGCARVAKVEEKNLTPTCRLAVECEPEPPSTCKTCIPLKDLITTKRVYEHTKAEALKEADDQDNDYARIRIQVRGWQIDEKTLDAEISKHGYTKVNDKFYLNTDLDRLHPLDF